jgi:hypothetical protein
LFSRVGDVVDWAIYARHVTAKEGETVLLRERAAGTYWWMASRGRLIVSDQRFVFVADRLMMFNFRYLELTYTEISNVRLESTRVSRFLAGALWRPKVEVATHNGRNYRFQTYRYGKWRATLDELVARGVIVPDQVKDSHA